MNWSTDRQRDACWICRLVYRWMDSCMLDWWMDGWVDRLEYGWMEHVNFVDGCMHAYWIGEGMDGWIKRWIEGQK